MHLCGCRKVDGYADKMATKNEIVESYWGKNILEGNCMDAATGTLSGGGRMTLEEAIKELSKSIKSALDIIGDAFRKIREQVEEPSK